MAPRDRLYVAPDTEQRLVRLTAKTIEVLMRFDKQIGDTRKRDTVSLSRGIRLAAHYINELGVLEDTVLDDEELRYQDKKKKRGAHV